MDPLFTPSAYFHKLECQRLPFPTQSTLLSQSFHSSRLGLSPNSPAEDRGGEPDLRGAGSDETHS